MKKILFLLTLLFCEKAFAQCQALNTNTVSLCPCPGELWDVSLPLQPSITFTGAGPSKRVMFTSYGFNIPTSATITGVQVSFSYSTANVTGSSLRDSLVTLMNGGFIIGPSKEALTGFYTGANSYTLGGPTDLWGTMWQPIMINNPGFGFNFKLISSQAGSHFSFVNSASITVCYDLPSGLKEWQSKTTDAKIYAANKQLKIRSQVSETSEVSIYSILGTKLSSFSMDGLSTKEIDLSSYSNGIYIYTLRTKTTERSGKFILN